MTPNPELNIWEHSKGLRELCLRRAMNLEPEMDAASQAASILAGLGLGKGERLLDVGCGAGHFIHSLIKRGLDINYYGLDYSPSFISIGKEAYMKKGLDPERLFALSIDELYGFPIDIALYLNVLSFNPDFRRPLFRAVENGAKHILVRDSFGDKTIIRWEPDDYLDKGKTHLRSYWNEWSRAEVEEFFKSLGWKSVVFIKDARTGGETELVVGKPYHWEFMLAEKG
jgi:SAM-dependent methyltransferase